MEIDVQSFVVATAEGLLHECRVGVGGPAVVYGPGCRDEFEGDVGGAIEAGEDGDLGRGFYQQQELKKRGREGGRSGESCTWAVIMAVRTLGG